MREKLIQMLDKFNYEFKEQDSSIMIRCLFNMWLIVNFSEDKITMTGKLCGWNFLTGFIPMKLKSAYVYSLVGTLIIIPFLIYCADFWPLLLVKFIFVFTVAWLIGNILFYKIELESMKINIYNWLK